MISNFPQAPHGYSFLVKNIGLGWIHVSLVKDIDQSVLLSRIAPRKDKKMKNRLRVDMSVEKNSCFHKTEEKDVVKTAHYLLRDVNKMKRLSQSAKNNIFDVEDYNQERFVGLY